MEATFVLDTYESLEVAICLYIGFGADLANYSIIDICARARFIWFAFIATLDNIMSHFKCSSLLCHSVLIGLGGEFNAPPFWLRNFVSREWITSSKISINF